eukprot:scaffold10524_cov113-Isochrysis_galbana.AAC.6
MGSPPPAPHRHPAPPPAFGADTSPSESSCTDDWRLRGEEALRRACCACAAATASSRRNQ